MIEMIADLPLEDRPRERLARYGAHTLTDAELLAILLGSGTEGNSAVAVAHTMVNGGLTRIAANSVEQLAKTKGVGLAKASRIVAAFELGRRFATRPLEDPPTYNPDALARKVMLRTRGWGQEYLGGVFLDGRRRVLRERERIFIGTIDQAIVSTRDVLRYALEENAVGVVLYHNHPSGDPMPSAIDHDFTKRMSEALELANMTLIDHLVVGSKAFVSMKGRGFY